MSSGAAAVLNGSTHFLSTKTETDELNRLLRALPTGAITLVSGYASCGKTALMLAALAKASREAPVALVDTNERLDIHSAVEAGIDLDKLLWVRCSGAVEHAMKAAELLLRCGSFGMVVFDIADLSPRQLGGIPSACWMRLRRAVEKNRTIFLVLEQISSTGSFSTAVLKLNNQGLRWAEKNRDLYTEPRESSLFQGLTFSIEHRKPRIFSNDFRFNAIVDKFS